MDANVRSDSVDVEQIMKQIRTRIREKRGSDYTEAELQRLASAKLEQFADPSGLRHDLLEQFRKRGDEPSTYHRHRGVRRLLLMAAHPLLKRVQKQLMADLNLYFEIIHNLVIEVTKLGIEVHNLKMKVESLSSRLDFDERRARSLEGVVQYRQRPNGPEQSGSGGQRSGGQSSGGQGSGPRGPQSTAPPQPAVQSSGPPQQSNQPQQTSQPSGPSPSPNQQGGDGDRKRRRRRRRRRPGSSLAESPNASARDGAPGGAMTAGGAQDTAGGDAGGDDGDEGADDQ